jgi:hypothetical protein
MDKHNNTLAPRRTAKADLKVMSASEEAVSSEATADAVYLAAIMEEAGVDNSCLFRSRERCQRCKRSMRCSERAR